MDITAAMPLVQEGKTVSNQWFNGFAISLQGASHLRKDPPVPCQDYSDIRTMDKERLLIAAIADGVGSCPLSHWGAYTAVNAALDSIQKSLTALADGKPLVLDVGNEQLRKALKQSMLNAFEAAVEAVENCADNAEPPQAVFSLQSTLSLAIYDGATLFHGHVGDDGIVAQTKDGQVSLATVRLKGEESNSVYPLQSGEKMWKFGATPDVAAFVMATDGVLDAFVARHPDAYGINYNNGVYYGFMEDAVYGLAEKEPDAARKTLEKYSDYLRGDDYRSSVDDDLTMVCVVSREKIQGAVHPLFSEKIWQTIDEESRGVRRRLLSGKPAAHSGMDLPQPGDAQEAAVSAPAAAAAIEAEKTSGIPKAAKIGLITGAVVLSLGLGVVAGRFLFPPVPVAEYDRVVRQCADLESEKDAVQATLTEAQTQLEETKRELERTQKQFKAIQDRNWNRLQKEQAQRKEEASEKEMVPEGDIAPEEETALEKKVDAGEEELSEAETAADTVTVTDAEVTAE